MYTSTLIRFGQRDHEIKRESKFNDNSALQPFSNLADLRTDNMSLKPYATWEPNFWKLDGSYHLLPDDPTKAHVGFMSEAMSNSSGIFGEDQYFVVLFDKVHTIISGLIIYFEGYSGRDVDSISVLPNPVLTGVVVKDLTIEYYDIDEVLIRSDTYPSPSYPVFFTGQAVADFWFIIITIGATNLPYRYARIRGIEYDPDYTLSGVDIKAASVVKEISPASITLPIGTLDVTIHSDDANFNPLTPPSTSYGTFTQGLPMSVHEVIGNEILLVGQYYLDTWKNKSTTEIEFHCKDLLSFLEKPEYVSLATEQPGISSNLADILADFFGQLGIPYELDASLAATTITGGWLPNMNARKALQWILFVVGAYADCGGDSVVHIRPLDLAGMIADYTRTVTDAEAGANENDFVLKPLVTGVELTAYHYAPDLTWAATALVMHQGEYEIGDYTILFDKPVVIGVAVTIGAASTASATVTEYRVNWAKINVSAGGTVVLLAQNYQVATPVYSVYLTPFPDGVNKNIVKIDGITLVDDAAAQAIAQRVYDYYLLRCSQKVRLFASSVLPGEILLMNTYWDEQVCGIVEKYKADLTGGMIVTVETRGGIYTI